jgi:hypothetical protein
MGGGYHQIFDAPPSIGRQPRRDDAFWAEDLVRAFHNQHLAAPEGGSHSPCDTIVFELQYNHYTSPASSEQFIFPEKSKHFLSYI